MSVSRPVLCVLCVLYGFPIRVIREIRGLNCSFWVERPARLDERNVRGANEWVGCKTLERRDHEGRSASHFE